ncbi:Vasoactive intestinal polypeptide receptor 1 [Bagarius yarrelli]|uniref:Vasoactive intestinal polypeptide receptor 1 n=1 Tax=Bagarius yarrelli TaxID=175774 RepID=A0A556V9R2_BAGYA|nr:Vasoactive intestinal polypeptide receptor 1 [Bagarius yarrelli]
MKAQELCSQNKKIESKNQTEPQGCKTEWDEIRCWLRADVGQVVNVSCLDVFQHFSSKQGYIYRNCTAEGWSDLYPPYEKACELGNDTEPESKVSCKSAVAFFQFSILANYFWLLVEGMYLQTLLALTFVSQRKYFWWYILTGWGVPLVVLIVWVLARSFYDNSGCWDDTDNVSLWWIIKGPITASLFANIIIFLNVIRILVEKLRFPAVGGYDTGHFMRLAKSTLLLIPLFGMHYAVFAFLPERTGETARLYIELGMGSFQVQTELKRSLWRWQTQNQLSPGKKRRVNNTQISVLDRSEQLSHFCPAKITSL